MFKNGLILLIASAVLLACGNKEDAIPFIAPQGTKPLPESKEERSDLFLESTAKSASFNSSSSRAIRRETLGLNLDIRYKDQNNAKADVVATVSFSEVADSCSQAIYRSTNVDAARFKEPTYKFTIEDFAEARCLYFDEAKNKCTYLYLTLTQTPSSVVSNSQSGNGLIPAAVPVVMENIGQSNGSEQFIPTRAEGPKFLQVPEYKADFQYCLKPVQIIQSAADVIFMIDPTSLYDDNDDYYTRPYDYTGNGFF